MSLARARRASGSDKWRRLEPPRQAAEANAIPARAPTIFDMLPDQLQNDAVVRAAFWQSQNVTLKAAAVAAPSFTSAAAPTGLTPGTPPPIAPLTQSDFYKFGNLVAEYVLRQPNARAGVSDAFAQTVSQYYQPTIWASSLHILAPVMPSRRFS